MTHVRTTYLTTAQADRAAGVMVAMACGDALGAPYEFAPALPEFAPVSMTGGGSIGWQPGEWTDDTQMAVVILQAAGDALASGGELIDRLDEIVVGWADWMPTASDVGVQTRAVLRSAVNSGSVTAESVLAASRRYADTHERSAGNGSLMRTAPVALAYLHDEVAMASAARVISDLTHADDQAGDACVLWCAAIRHAVLTGEFDVRVGMPLLPEGRRDEWLELIHEAETTPAPSFVHNGWVVHAFQAAWSAIVRTAIPHDDPASDSYAAEHLQLALEAAVRVGHDTDTVAAIAGSLLGGRWGLSAVPSQWRRVVHGWPGLTARDLAALGSVVARGGVDQSGWPNVSRVDYSGYGARGRLTVHPHDSGVLLGDAADAEHPPAEVDAIVSLCRVGRDVAPGVPDSERIEVWLIDKSHPDENLNLDFVLADTADVIAALRAEGHTVLVHCVAAQSRTPTVGAAYSIRHLGIPADRAVAEVCAALPDARINRRFEGALLGMNPSLGR